MAAVLPSFGADTNPDGDLRIEVVTAYNLVVDSNVESPSTYAPRSAYLAAKFYNDGSSTLSNVWAYIGDYTNNTPGIYPQRAHLLLDGPIEPGNAFALTHEGGAMGTADASRFLGDIEPGEHVTVYWLISYPNLDASGNAVHGPSVKPDDDLFLYYDIWGTADEGATAREACVRRRVTMRNEISASANKILPNGANKVPDQYKEALNLFNATWTNTFSDGSPGTAIWTEGFWYDLGNVGKGFDNDGDLVPDQNVWMQPVGDPTTFDPSSFRLVATYAMVIVKLKGGGEQIILAEDQLYFEYLPDNRGAVGLVRYEFLTLRPGANSSLSPYQEVASGFDNEKFNGDFGASLGGALTSPTSAVRMVKSADVATVDPGDSILYTVTYTNPGAIAVGNPSQGLPLVVQDSIPTGAVYVAGSAAISNTLPAGVTSYTIFYSTNNGTSFVDTEPATAADVTDVRWRLSDILQTNSGGSVTFSVTADSPYTNSSPRIFNVAGLSFGDTVPFVEDDASTMVLGTNEVGDTVFLDDGGTTGTIGNGVQDGDETGISNITVSLYYDADGDMELSAADFFLTTAVTATNGTYLFSNLLDGPYIAVVDGSDPDLPFGTAVSTPTEIYSPVDVNSTNAGTVAFLDADFGFVPILGLDKKIQGVTGTATNREADTLVYDITVTNRLAPNGTAAVYEVWATNINNLAFYTKASAWTDVTNAYNFPDADGAYASVDIQGGDDQIGLEGFRIAAQQGSITNVEIVFPVQIASGWVNDDLILNLYTNADGATAAAFSTNLALENLTVGTYELVYNVTSVKTWDWTDFGPNETNILQMVYSKNNAAGRCAELS